MISLVIPNESHQAEYARVMDQWEALEDNIQPQLMRRYSDRLKANVDFAKWLSWCEDDRTTGSMLSTGVPCTLYFLMSGGKEILGSIVINHGNTRRGHMHAGIVPWQRGRGYGTQMLRLALAKAAEMGMEQVFICPDKGNFGAIEIILRNGGVLVEEFDDNGLASLRYEIPAQD